MPIRTHRGRAAVYRRLWGWPLRSPLHLVFSGILLVVLATGVGYLLPAPPPSEPLADAQYRPESASVPTPEPHRPAPPTLSVPDTPPPQVPPSPEGLNAVREWGRLWCDHPAGTVPQQWLERLRPHMTEEFTTIMASVDPANIAPTALTGEPIPLESTPMSLRVRLPTNAGDLEVLANRTPQGWRVAEYDEMG